MDHFSMLMERNDKHKGNKSAASRLATGAIVGIAIACLVFLGMLLCCYCCCFRRRRERSRELESQPHKPKNPAKKLDKLRRLMKGNNKEKEQSAPPAAQEPAFNAQYPQVQQPGPVYK